MKKVLKIFLIQFAIMSIIYWGLKIYGEFEKQYNPIGDGIIFVFLILIQLCITFLIVCQPPINWTNFEKQFDCFVSNQSQR